MIKFDFYKIFTKQQTYIEIKRKIHFLRHRNIEICRIICIHRKKNQYSQIMLYKIFTMTRSYKKKTNLQIVVTHFLPIKQQTSMEN